MKNSPSAPFWSQREADGLSNSDGDRNIKGLHIPSVFRKIIQVGLGEDSPSQGLYSREEV